MLPFLVIECVLYYVEDYGVLFYFGVGNCFGFVLWWFGWVSSLYNMGLWGCRNLLNGVVFGEKVSHGGNNYREKIWWVNYLVLSLNIMAIGVNSLIFRSSLIATSKQTQTQHILLVCMSSLTSLISTMCVYFYLSLFSCSLRFRWTWKQYLNMIVNILIPMIVSFLIVYGVNRIYGGYGDGRAYDK